MTIANLKWSQKATAMREILASNDVRTLIANQLGVDIKHVTNEQLCCWLRRIVAAMQHYRGA